MIEIMKTTQIIKTGFGKETILTIKLDPKYNSGLVQRLNSEILLSKYEGKKKSGFTIQTYTSFSGIKANLLIGATNVDIKALKDTLEYFEQIHACKLLFINSLKISNL